MYIGVTERNTEKIRKDRIMIFSHPEDEELISVVAMDVLNIYDCEINSLYSDKSKLDLSVNILEQGVGIKNSFYDISEDEAEYMLGQMNLVIFISSESFLYEKSFVKDVLFAGLKKNHYRFLPLVISEELIRPFNSSCGSYHVLNMTAPDYNSRLKFYIESCIDTYNPVMTEDLRDLINSLFSFKTFISYRKKDIKYLTKLVDEIRTLPEFYDMSIWYDDMLINGEEYNKRIDDELIESDVVIFVVTPSLLEPDNYVMKIEYPRAVELGNVIIPVLMEDVDKEELKRLYPEFYYLVDGNDLLSLSYMLCKVREDLDINYKVLTSEQKYYISKEYKEGVETEKNIKLSDRLLNESAEEGFVWALYEKANKKIAEEDMSFVEEFNLILPTLYDILMDENTLDEEIFSVGQTVVRICDALIKFYTSSDIQYTKKITYIENEALNKLQKLGFVSDKCNAGKTYEALGDAAYEENNFVDAIENYLKAEEHYKGLYEMTKSETGLLNVSMISQKLGNVYFFIFREKPIIKFLLLAEENYNKALEGFKKLLPWHDGFCINIMQILSFLNSIGTMFEKIMGDKAEEIYQKIYREIQEVRKKCYMQELESLYVTILCNVAIFGKDIPDKDLLLEAYEVIVELIKKDPRDEMYLQTANYIKKALLMWPKSPG